MTLGEHLSLTVARMCSEGPARPVRVDRVFRNRRTGFRLRIVDASVGTLTFFADNAANGWGGEIAAMSRKGVADVFDPRKDSWKELPPMSCEAWRMATCPDIYLSRHEPMAKPEPRVVFAGMVDVELLPPAIVSRRFRGKEA